MAHIEASERSRVLELVHELAGERDPIRLAHRGQETLGRILGARWSCSLGRGEGPLGALHVSRDCVDPAAEVDALGFAEEPTGGRPQVRVAAGRAGACLWLPQRTRLYMAFGDVPDRQQDAWRDILDDGACYLSSRLHDVLQLQRATLANTALERRISDLSLLFKGLDVTLSSVELTKVLRALLTCVTSGEAIGFNRAFLLMVDEEKHQLRGTVAVGPSSGEEANSIWQRLEAEHASLEEILRRSIEDPERPPAPGSLADRIRRYTLPLDPRHSVLARAATPDGVYNIHLFRGDAPEPFADAFGAREFVAIPILGRERTLGVVVADNLYTGKPIDMDRAYLLSGLANHVGVVIENALMFEDVSSRYAELNEVQHVNRALLSNSDYADVLREIAKICCSMLPASGTLLFLSDGQPARAVLETEYSALGVDLPQRAVARCAELAQETLDRAAGALGSDLTAEGDAGAGVAANLLSAPMSIDNEVVGVLVVYRSQTGGESFDRHSRRFLSIIADQAAIAILSGRRLRTIREDQAQIEKLNQLLYRNEKLAALGQASSQIAHEIRNPLTALGGFARRILRSPKLEGRDREAVDVIVRETERLERILNDQLSFVHSARLQREPTQLNDVVRESCQLLRHLVEGKRARLELELDTALPSAVADADRIKQVLVNLLMNALAAVDKRGRIRVTTRNHGAHVEVEVANDGPPIPAEVETSLFLPFVTTRQEGSGLGLAVVHQIVTEHGGRIQVRSMNEWGGVFTIELPLQPPSA
jgi:signal transduction histidine kinase